MRKFVFHFKRFVSSSYGLAILLSLPLWWMFFQNFPQFELVKQEEGILQEKSVSLWDDFSSNGETEKIYCYPWRKDFYAFPVTQANGEVKEQFNIPGEPGGRISESVFSGDFDGNGKSEIYVLLHKNDSIRLNIVEPYGRGHFIKDQFIALARDGKAGIDYAIRSSQLYDVENDGKKEFLFLIAAGFSLEPRCAVLFNIEKQSVKKSPYLGAHPFGLRVMDLDKDGKPEILISNFASANSRPPFKGYNDNSAYLFVLDEKLQPVFDPKEFEGPTQFLELFPFRFQGKDCWGAFHKCASKYEEMGYWFYLFDKNGNEIKKKHYPYQGIESYLHVYPIKNTKDVVVLRGSETLYRLDQNLNLIKLTDFSERLTFLEQEDLNQDGEIESIFVSRKGQYLYVFRDDFSKYVKHEIKCLPADISFSLIRGKYQKQAFYLQAGRTYFEFTYHEIPYYYLKVLAIAIGIYLCMLLLVLFIQKVTSVRDRRRKKMAELQLVSWKNQLDPHFTFNTLNSVGAVILSEERYEAYDFFSRFSKLMRYALEASSKVAISLEEELQFIDLYLQLEQFRFKNQFEYKIDVSEAVSRKMKVPKMLMQTYVENAVRHGLMDRQEGGLLEIKVYKAGNNVVFQIEDNGIGRTASLKKENLGNGVGMKVMKDYFDLLNSVNSKPIRIKILNQNESNEIYPGTIVYILFPLGFNFEL